MFWARPVVVKMTTNCNRKPSKTKEKTEVNKHANSKLEKNLCFLNFTNQKTHGRLQQSRCFASMTCPKFGLPI